MPTILVTGANRGIGHGLTETYLLRAHTTVLACVRDPGQPTSASLSSLPKHPTSRLLVLKIDSADPADPPAALAQLQVSHGTTAIDTVVANAGISTTYPAVADARPQDLLDHFAVNVLGPLALFQAVRPLLLRSPNPKFVTMSSSAGSIGAMEACPFPNAAYGTSKAALNYITRKMHFEEERVCALAMDPGWVQTEMGNVGAVKFGVASGKAETPVEESVAGLVDVIDKATKERHSGKFLKFTGGESAW